MNDRCDRCGAQAFTRATLAAGELLFCAHHGRAYLDKLVEVAEDIAMDDVPVDNRQQGQP